MCPTASGLQGEITAQAEEAHRIFLFEEDPTGESCVSESKNEHLGPSGQLRMNSEEKGKGFV